jgi:hypothetical protein
MTALDHKILYLDSQLQKIYMQDKMQRCFCFQDQNWRFIKKNFITKKNNNNLFPFWLDFVVFCRKTYNICSPVLFEHPKMQHFLMIYSDLMIKKLWRHKKTLSIHVKTSFKITPTLKIDLVFTYMLPTKILVQLAI